MHTLRSLTAAGIALAALLWGLGQGIDVRSFLLAHDADPADPARSVPAGEETPDNSAAGDPGAAGDSVSSRALRLISDAAAKLAQYDSIRAELIETVSIGDRRFKVTGTYLKGRNHKMALRYRVVLGESEGIYEEICDGDVLWTLSQIRSGDSESQSAAEKPVLTRRDVKEILAETRKHGELAEQLQLLDLGLGGLPAMLGALTQRVLFDEITEEAIDDSTFAVLEGGWTPEFLPVLHGVTPNDKLSEKQLAEVLKRPLPEHVPDRVRLYFDKQDFPRRVQYLKRPGGSGPLMPMVTLDLVRVTLNGEVHDSDFQYTPPPGLYPNDVTQHYLDELRQAAAARRAQQPPK